MDLEDLFKDEIIRAYFGDYGQDDYVGAPSYDIVEDKIETLSKCEFLRFMGYAIKAYMELPPEQRA